ncbi:TPA: TIGR04255 family protein [Klebsiella pneumoniae]|uniref:TIGR04255 family protein n=1 Tax=Klebsiella pneumoniae TaxID=573 RepID=A0A422ZX85_KLEPN|nr:MULTISPECIES: TIGR04255 family protein [Klebsiella]EIV2296791.1 TIGR04255 family protein [Klebsiella pneumoniae]EIW8913643.1 TIGR04255 family protein [Klebsiella pneumoniae]EJB8127582.1 TIGR04255 family protein [Klebsiella pneumoniae]EJD6436398.1 TIGR04255 family protein [Klebsiella pneumoniae]EKK0517260.1 TIGR04255 family protein [Klebsiella pneumoniae]
MRIPTSLKKQPVIEAAFELRYPKDTQVSEIVPGFLFHALGCKKPVISLPPSQIPKNVREDDEQLHYALVSRLEVEDYFIGLSDHGIVISTSGAYKGWTHFKSMILKVLVELDKLHLNNNISRYSIKYVDFFEAKDNDNLFPKLNIDVVMAGESMSSYPLTLRLDKPHQSFDIIIQVVSHALVLANNETYNRNGLILDIDTIKRIQDESELISFNSDRQSALDQIHECNKITFFSCIRESTLEELEPVY